MLVTTLWIKWAKFLCLAKIKVGNVCIFCPFETKFSVVHLKDRPLDQPTTEIMPVGLDCIPILRLLRKELTKT